MIGNHLPPYRNGALCPRCQKGHIQSRDSGQICDWCGRILWQSPTVIEFRQLAIGERFYNFSDPDHLWIRASAAQRQQLQMEGAMDSYRADAPHLHSGHGPLAPVIREEERRMHGATFTYN